MNEENYSAWMNERGDQPNTINTSLSTMRRLLSHLSALNLPPTLLEEPISADAFEQFDRALRELQADMASGGERYRLLTPNTNNPARSLHNLRSHLRKYRRYMLNEEDAGSWVSLERLKQSFLSKATGFEDFSQLEGRYYDEERAYKQELLDNYVTTLAEEMPLAELGEALYMAARSKGGGLLLRWQTKRAIQDDHPELHQRFLEVLGQLARTVPIDGRDAIWRAASELQDLRDAGIRKLTHGEIWGFAVTIAGLADPTLAAPFKISVARQISSELLGKKLFQGNAPHKEDLDAWLDLLERIYDIMEQDWGWKPKDLLDVQGFLWMVRQNEQEEDSACVIAPGQENRPSIPKSSPKNIILQGPPGTGKTWSTASEAVALCDDSVPESRDEVMIRYNELKAAGQIEFVTFHQSFSYEEFVEGLRPVTESDSADEVSTGGFSLQPHKGVFRQICDLAEEARTRSASNRGFELGDRRIFKMSLGIAGVEDDLFDNCVDSGVVALGWGGEEDWSHPQYREFDEVRKRWNEIEPGTSGRNGNIVQTWRFREMNIGDLIVITAGNLKFRAIAEITSDYLFRAESNIDYPHQRRVKWLKVLDTPLPAELIYTKRFSQASCYMFDSKALRRDAISRLLSNNNTSASGAPDQFVIVIDEINRANISKVFGELITLIETDKRLGQRNALTVRLPYSGDTFGVPDNLHILATMNTADRSIALLDTALRRRFTFTELLPDPEILDSASEATGVDLVALLNTLNDRIEYLYDREHQIGHAYFTHCQKTADVEEAMRDRIIPLLCEYFYEDWEKVALVLGDPRGELMLERQKLHPPPEMEGYDEDRWRWSVRSTFAPNPYNGLT